MITFQQAYDQVLNAATGFETESVALENAHGRILAEAIHADRDFPPFNRATKDGIAIQFRAGQKTFKIQEIAAAGMPQKTLKAQESCLEIMTGAIVPENADTIVMYEHIALENGEATLLQPVKQGQNIHYQGSDEPQDSLLLQPGIKITAAEIGVLASVGKAEIQVKKNPKVALFSTGDELVPITETPALHQIRQSNAHTLKAALSALLIPSTIIHVLDEKNAIKTALKEAIETYDVLVMSGGVSKGKYDFLPEVLEELGVTKYFHRVKQRPGKPFWFGKQEDKATTIFGFPGNPTSTFANFHVYFIPWLYRNWGLPTPEIQVFLEEDFENTTPLTRFIRAKTTIIDGQLSARLVHGNGSGDLTSLTMANGFVRVAPNEIKKQGEIIPFIPARTLL